MPIPFILGGIAIGTGLLGIGKGIKAGIDMKDAKDTNERANTIVDDAKDELEERRKASGKSLEALGSKKLYILDKSMNRFVSAFEQLKNVELTESVGLDELAKFRIDKQSLTELKEMGGYAASILGGTAAGALGGALTAFGAYGAAMTFATASTGTAIATLSGAAATNATLAFFGGGSLAAGGLGMAGGAAVLGGLVAGPALAVMGFVIGAKASAQVDEAYSNLARARKIREELETAGVACNAIRRRAYLFYRLFVRLDSLFLPLIVGMEKAIVAHGTDFSSFTDDEKHTVAAAVSIAGAIKAVLDTPLLTEDGKLTDESAFVAQDVGSKVGTKNVSTDKDSSVTLYVKADSAPKLWVWQPNGEKCSEKMGFSWDNRPSMQRNSEKKGWFSFTIPEGCYTRGKPFSFIINNTSQVDTDMTSSFYYDGNRWWHI